MPIIDHFDFLAPYYDHFILVPDTRILENLLGLPINGPLLDAGGGTGRIAQNLIDKASEIVIVDLSMGMMMQSNSKGNFLKILACTEMLPFIEESFERIIMVDTLHHVNNQEQTAYELVRILKPGGRMVIEEPDIDHFVVKLVALAEKVTLMKSRFLRTDRIIELFPSDEIETSVYKENFNTWIVIEKNFKKSAILDGSHSASQKPITLLTSKRALGGRFSIAPCLFSLLNFLTDLFMQQRDLLSFQGLEKRPALNHGNKKVNR